MCCNESFFNTLVRALSNAVGAGTETGRGTRTKTGTRDRAGTDGLGLSMDGLALGAA